LSTSFEVAWYVSGQEQRDHEHRCGDQNDDADDQPAAAFEGVEIAPDLDWIVRRELGRCVSSNAVVRHSPVRHGS
jgi:hypothetical protein